MHRNFCYSLLITLLLSTAVCYGGVDFSFQKRLTLDETPLDIKLAVSGQYLYVLTEKGQLRIYTHNGVFVDKIAVGPDFDQIEPGRSDEEIYLKNSRSKSIQVVALTYQFNIATQGAPFKGREDAPVVIVEYTDFQCPYCARLVPIFNELLKHYPNQIKIVYKNFPLNGHPFAQNAAAAAMAAHQKGKFWEFHDQLFANYYQMSDAIIQGIQKELGLDTPEFETLKASPEIAKRIQQDKRQGQHIGVKSTPSVFVNGKIQKDRRLEGFIETIDKELKTLK